MEFSDFIFILKLSKDLIDLIFVFGTKLRDAFVEVNDYFLTIGSCIEALIEKMFLVI